ncbi:butyryl-CoA dehydrogenase [Microbacterium sp. Root61]|uniref:acyl-CoA dehydrogenase family protein n=1 Tax=Microbacterium sp. Root61 TaxID=1736570 RepID=UPI0006F33A70|nr:acyl-CoA dehydrogenase family protein [Microbacterium sp. Root61]KRA25270.1 butyryl-CoA dehydrogenase [Microbacterium sp. Root61]
MVPADELVQLREEVRRFAHARYADRAREWDAARQPVTAEERLFLGQQGYLGIAIPEAYGGSGGKYQEALVVVEELGRVYASAAFQVFEANTGPAQAILAWGTEELKQRYLPAIARGEVTMAVAISEPDAGSAATDMRTKAEIKGDRIVLNGRKRWISNGGEADAYLVYARMSDAPGSRGIGAVVVDAGTPGLSFGERERLMGFRTVPSADVVFDDVEVPLENLVVRPPDGFKKLFGAFSIERLGNTTMSIALAQEALDRTVRYVQEREQFGRPIADFQAVQLTLADMLIAVESARLLRDRAVESLDRGELSVLEVSLAKCAANEMARVVTAKAIELHGGNGYTEEFELERFHRDSHGWALAGGTPAIQKMRIASELLGRSVSQRPAVAG